MVNRIADREVAQVWTFPTDISQFDEDDRISYSQLDHKYIAVQDDGTEFEFDTSLKRWIPVLDDAENDNAGASSIYENDGQQPETRKRKPDFFYYQNEVSCTRCCFRRRLCAA